MADDGVLPIWNPDGLGLLGGKDLTVTPVEPARGEPGYASPDEQLVQPGVLQGATPQDGGGAGPTGPTGPTGHTGSRGTHGTRGTRGTQGTRGTIGPTGHTGPTGPGNGITTNMTLFGPTTNGSAQFIDGVLQALINAT